MLISDWLYAMYLLAVDMFKSVFIKVLFLGIGGALIVLSHFTAKERRAIEQGGVDTTAVITEMKERHRVGKNKHDSYAIYLDVPGASPRQKVSVSSGEFKKLKNGDIVAIRQLPEEPERFYAKFKSDDSMWTRIIGIGFLLIGLVLVLRSLLRMFV